MPPDPPFGPGTRIARLAVGALVPGRTAHADRDRGAVSATLTRLARCVRCVVPMTAIEASLAVYWGLMAAVSLVVAIRHRPLARWALPRLSGGVASPGAHRACEWSLLLAGIGLVIISITALYGAAIVLPRLDRTLEQIRSTQRVTRPAAEGQEI